MVQIQQIEIPPGHRTLFRNLNWQAFEGILQDLGEQRTTRVAYAIGTLEIRMPSPEHERVKVLLAHLLVILLDDLEWDWESLGSTTFKNPACNVGIEPDDCFYIQNYAAILGKQRLDLTIDPPPDLAIEVDLTSKTRLSAYTTIRVPEIWRYQDNTLTISVLEGDTFINALSSRIFPNIPIISLFSEYLANTSEPMSAICKAFRVKIKTLDLS
ncbi:Uma2 family endonuclease [Acaryochloris sp. IP29b_bin.148]|uniref:Uma2 family endonuclease n=1 Tax=Acaryochloris sp. IP29b_bin.148 TaxID=2969218 RepID=UPI0026116880|nr:Uma2 family endonuclease [Acaryochloris sp. IP29b_bin.148]